MQNMAKRSGRRVVWAAVTVAAALAASAGAQAADTRPMGMTLLPAPAATLAQLTQDVGGRGATQTPARYAYLRKLSGHLQAIALNGGGDASVDVYVTGPVARAADDLRALGMRVGAVSDRAPSRVVEGVLPPGALAQAAALPDDARDPADLRERQRHAVGGGRRDLRAAGPRARADGRRRLRRHHLGLVRPGRRSAARPSARAAATCRPTCRT